MARIKSRLLRYDELPHWLQDNHYILGSYRDPSWSFKESLRSLTYLHTESVNIHTHLWGVVAVIVGLWPVLNTLSTRHASVTWHDAVAFGIWFSSAVFCLSMSASYHTVSNHSPKVSATAQKMDHLGVVIMTAGSFISMLYYGWYCEPIFAYAFQAMIIIFSIACATFSLNPKTRTPAWRPYRAAMFAALGFSALVPITIGLYKYGIEGMNTRMSLFPWLSLELGCYLTGAILYAARFPERLSPGTFDVWGSSHQIFHVLILCAAASHLKGLFVTFDWNHQSGACSSRGLT